MAAGGENADGRLAEPRNGSTAAESSGPGVAGACWQLASVTSLAAYPILDERLTTAWHAVATMTT